MKNLRQYIDAVVDVLLLMGGVIRYALVSCVDNIFVMRAL